MQKSYELIEYHKAMEPQLAAFLKKCLPESGRSMDTEDRRSYYLGAAEEAECFLCLLDNAEIIGTVAVKRLDDTACELRSMYLFGRYHGKGLGRRLLERAVAFAREKGYAKMYLDTFSTSTRALALYRRAGFTDTARYKPSERSDVFMVLELTEK